MKKDTKKRFLHKLEMKMQSEMNYLSYISSKTSFRKAIWLQVGELVKAIETEIIISTNQFGFGKEDIC